MGAETKKMVIRHARLVIAAEAAYTVLKFTPVLSMYLGQAAIRDLKRLAKECPEPPRPMYSLDKN